MTGLATTNATAAMATAYWRRLLGVDGVAVSVSLLTASG